MHIKLFLDATIRKILSLTMVFQNPLANAIKYTPNRGKISLTIRLEGIALSITVADTGIGIPKKDRPLIFQRFFRADNAKEREPEGIGLGLYILKAIIDLMGGKIWFTSRENKG